MFKCCAYWFACVDCLAVNLILFVLILFDWVLDGFKYLVLVFFYFDFWLC